MTDDIRGWLQKVGLAKYADAFVFNDVDLDVLADLSEDHLRELGVSLGNRLRLLKAIRLEFGGSAFSRLKPLAPMGEIESGSLAPPPAELSTALPMSDAERRPLTVVFCDLADSTALSTKLDPEDLQDVIRSYQETSTKVIHDYHGFVAKYMGDGILVYFGYPKSLGRNAERAVRSALGIVEAMAGLNVTLGRDKGIEIAVRIGIATGMVMVGEVVGEGMAQERAVIGEAPNMAARLQSLAGRNGIVIGSLTKELSGETFVYDDMGTHELKGISGLVHSWGVVGLREDGSQEADENDTDGAATVTDLVGRDEETGLLRRAWLSTKDEGRGQVVTITGEAGIGKSVLIDGLKSKVRVEGLPRVTMRCSPYHINSAFHPVIEHFKRLAGWRSEDHSGARLAKLEAALGAYSQPLAETVPLLASLLSLVLPESRYPPLTMTPQQQKQRTQDAIIAITLEAAERQPLLQVWEDVHWADPSTLEFIGLLIEQAPTASLLMVLIARPEFVRPWPARSHITPITLNRLERPHAEALVGRIAGMKPLPAEVVDHIVTKTDGVPLYVEEMTKTILASDILRDAGDHFELTGPLSSLSIPDTLQESLMARLDRLPQVRELAQLGSVLGREFAYEMISGLSTLGDAILQEGLSQLVETELLYQRGRPPRARYVFKHALVQDAAYGSLLRRARQQAHSQVAALLEGRFPETVEIHPELLAHHLAEAGIAERAVEYYQKAGQRSLQKGANQEAIAHLTKGLEIINSMPAGRGRDQHELHLRMTKGPALIATKGYAALDVEAVYRRAWKLCQDLGDLTRQFSALHGLWWVMYYNDLHAARDLAEQLVEVAKGQKDAGLDLAAKRALGYTLHYLGELEAARSCLQEVITLYNPAIHAAYAFRHGGADVGSGSLSMKAWTLFALGYPDQAMGHIERGLALARKLDHPLSEVWALTTAAVVHQFRGEPQAMLANAEAAKMIAEDRGLAQYVSWAGILRGWAIFDDGDGDEEIAELRSHIDASRTTGASLLVPYWLTLLASACNRVGQAQDGLAVVTEALATVAQTNERFEETELHRLKGELLLACDAANVAEAEACFHRAIEIARSQKAKAWELRAATSLARLWRRQGKQAEARELLSEIYGWFTEGFGTADLVAARELLEG